MSLAIVRKPVSDNTHKKKQNAAHVVLTNPPTVFPHPQAPIVQCKPFCPCDGGCPRCAGVVQSKLKISKPNDIYEREADRIAEQVMRMPDTEYAASGGKKGGIEKLETKGIVQSNISAGQAICIQRQARASSMRGKSVTVPQWEQLPSLAQTELTSKGYDKSWFDARRGDNSIRLTVLNLYVKLRGLNLWNHVGREIDKKAGALQFSASDVHALKNVLNNRDDFTSPEDSPDKWSSREKRASGSLHFKHFRGWPEEKVQAHIDQAGLLLRSPAWWLTLVVPLVQMGRHLVEYLFGYDDFTDVFGIRDILLGQGWWAEPLVGVGATVQRKAMSGSSTSAVDRSPNIDRLRGQPLPMSVRIFFESRFGHDFSRVSVHTDDRAAAKARALNAAAFTVGKDIAFAKGQYAPETISGQKLLAHELTHVVQQRGGLPGHSIVQRRVMVNPTAAINDILGQFNFLCLGNWGSSGQIITGHAIAVTTNSCECLEDAVNDTNRTYTINVDAVSSTRRGLTLHNGRFEPAVPFPSSGPRTYNWGANAVIHVASSTGSAMEFGFFEPSGRAAWCTNWRILAHELCGHARLKQEYTNIYGESGKGDRPEHDFTVAVENRIAAEHGGAQRGYYNDPGQGEVFHNPIGNQTMIVYRLVDGWHYEPPLPIPPQPTAPITGEITASALRIRERPDTSSPTVGYYPQGTIIIIECQHTGEKVDNNSLWDKTDRGYVSDRYVRRNRPADIKLPTCWICSAAGCYKP